MIYLLYGEDTYRSREKLNQIKKKFKEVYQSAVNLITLDGEKASFKEIRKEILTLPFLYKKKLIIIENLLSKKPVSQQSDFANFLEHQKIPENTILVFWEEKNLDSRTKLFKLLNKSKNTEKFDLLKEKELEEWIKKEIEKRKGKISLENIHLLACLVGSDLWQMNNEINKLLSFCQDYSIQKEDIYLLVKGKYDDNIFNLVDALGQKNQKLALKLLNDQIESGANELYLLTMLTRQFRILLQIKEITEKTNNFLKQNIAQETGIHPYVAQKAMYQVKNYSFFSLKNIYQELLEIDVKIKKGLVEPKTLLYLFISKITIF